MKKFGVYRKWIPLHCKENFSLELVEDKFSTFSSALGYARYLQSRVFHPDRIHFIVKRIS